MKDGWFTGASTYTHYADVSRKVAMQAKQAMEMHWKFEAPTGKPSTHVKVRSAVDSLDQIYMRAV